MASALTARAFIRSLGAHATVVGIIVAVTALCPQTRPDDDQQHAQIEILIGTNAQDTGTHSLSALTDAPHPEPEPPSPAPTSPQGIALESAPAPGAGGNEHLPRITGESATSHLDSLSEPAPATAPTSAEVTSPAPPASPREDSRGTPASHDAPETSAPPEIRVGDGIAATAADIEDAGIVHPAKSQTGNVAPEYPIEAARRRERGTVLLRIFIAADGSVTRVSVLQSSGSQLLDRAARERIATWHFEPARRDGQPVPDVEDQAIRFVPE